MKTEQILSIIRTKFIENLDEGLLLKEDKDLNRDPLTDEEEKYYYENCGSYSSTIDDSRGFLIVPKKERLIHYLSAIFLKTKIKGKYIIYDFSFKSQLWEYWRSKVEVLQSILTQAPEYINAERITDNDKIYINVGYRSWGWVSRSAYNNKTYDSFEVYNNNSIFHFSKNADCKPIVATFADIFIFKTNQFIKLSLGKDGPIDRAPHLFRDIKKINISNKNLLEIYFHGHYDPETIVIDDYNSALQLQNNLTELRQKSSGNNHNNGQRRT